MTRDEMIAVINKYTNEKFSVYPRISKGHEKEIIIKNSDGILFEIYNFESKKYIKVFSKSWYLNSLSVWKKYELNFKPSYDFKYFLPCLTQI